MDKSGHRKPGNVTSLSLLYPQLSKGNSHGVLQAKSLAGVWRHCFGIRRLSYALSLTSCATLRKADHWPQVSPDINREERGVTASQGSRRDAMRKYTWENLASRCKEARQGPSAPRYTTCRLPLAKALGPKAWHCPRSPFQCCPSVGGEGRQPGRAVEGAVIRLLHSQRLPGTSAILR